MRGKSERPGRSFAGYQLSDCGGIAASAIFLESMYDDFQAVDRWSSKPAHCRYQALIVAIATRHADAVDIKFLVDDRPVWIALPHPAWVEYNRQTGKVISDPMAVQIAGHYLKWAIESGEDNGREMYTLTVQETLDQLHAVMNEARQLVGR
jgi:hypothetical protein